MTDTEKTRPVAIITGGTRGIGRATALMAARAGHDLCLSYAGDHEAAEATQAECRELGAACTVLAADIGRQDEVARLFAHCDEAHGAPALLVNNAGIIGAASPAAELDPAALTRCFEVNLHGSFWAAQQAFARMARSRGGQGGAIVNVSSIAARTGSPGEYVHYAASKAAVETMTLGLAREWGPEGIRVNALRAGTTETDIHARSGNPDRPAAVAARSPLGRVAQPDEMAAAILWLASEAASYVNGVSLPVDGAL